VRDHSLCSAPQRRENFVRQNSSRVRVQTGWLVVNLNKVLTDGQLTEGRKGMQINTLYYCCDVSLARP